MSRAIENPVARRNELAQIHIGVTALKWSDDDYRAILFAKTGKTSAAELDSTGRKRFLDHMRSCGWKGGQKPFTQAAKIAWLWRKLFEAGGTPDGSQAALLAFVGRVAGMGVSDLKFLPTADASNVIEALKARLNRSKI